MRGTLLAASATAAAAAAAAAYYLRKRRRPLGPRVIVASKAAVKLAAARTALGASEVTGVSAPSLVEEQPVSMETTSRGAANRLQHVCATAGEGYDFAVAFENGLVRLQTSLGGGDEASERWLDVAVVAVCDLRTRTTSVASSAGVEFPASCVGEWAEAGEEGTVGEVTARPRHTPREHARNTHSPTRTAPRPPAHPAGKSATSASLPWLTMVVTRGVEEAPRW